MSSSKLISGDELNGVQRWELPTVQNAGGKRPRVENAGPGSVRPPTAKEMEQIRADAKREGFEAGHKEGVAAGQKEIHTVVQRLGQVINALAAPLEEVDEQVEQELASLALAIARQIIRRELKVDPGEVVAVVRDALAALPAASRRVQVHLHPADAKVVHELMHPGAGGEEPTWRIVEDPSLTRGGCRVHTEHSQIDATVETRVAAIAAQLFGGERESDRPA